MDLVSGPASHDQQDYEEDGNRGGLDKLRLALLKLGCRVNMELPAVVCHFPHQTPGVEETRDAWLISREALQEVYLCTCRSKRCWRQTLMGNLVYSWKGSLVWHCELARLSS